MWVVSPNIFGVIVVRCGLVGAGHARKRGILSEEAETRLLLGIPPQAIINDAGS